jgi:hypothetical protein
MEAERTIPLKMSSDIIVLLKIDMATVVVAHRGPQLKST